MPFRDRASLSRYYQTISLLTHTRATKMDSSANDSPFVARLGSAFSFLGTPAGGLICCALASARMKLLFHTVAIGSLSLRLGKRRSLPFVNAVVSQSLAFNVEEPKGHAPPRAEAPAERISLRGKGSPRQIRQ